MVKNQKNCLIVDLEIAQKKGFDALNATQKTLALQNTVSGKIQKNRYNFFKNCIFGQFFLVFFTNGTLLGIEIYGAH